MAAEGQPSPIRTRPKPRPARRQRRWLLAALSLVLLGLVVLLGVGSGWGFSRPSAQPQPGHEVAPAPTGAFSVLILGADDRPGEPGRSDTLLLSTVDPARKQVKLMSIERDLLVKIPGHGYDKLNAAYAYGKEGLALQTLQDTLGLSIDHYVVVDMPGFEQIIGILGGVDLNVEENMNYDDPYDTPPLHIHLKQGFQHLSAAEALQYARFRHDAEGNTGRMRRQRQLMQAVAKEALLPANLLKLPEVALAAFRAVRTDLSLSQLLKLAATAKDFGAQSVTSAGALTGEDYWQGGVSYQKADLVQLRSQAYAFLSGSEPPAGFLERANADQQSYLADLGAAPADPAPQQTVPAPTGNGRAPAPAPKPAPGPQTAPGDKSHPDPQPISVVLHDASGKKLAARYAASLRDAGFVVVSSDAAKAAVPTTTVHLPAHAAGARERLQAVFPKASFQTSSAGGGTAPVEITLGADLPS